MAVADIPYSVPDVPWDEAFGKHRARVAVEAEADAVRLHLQWRRRDHDAHERQIIIVHGQSGRRVENLARADINREFADLVFEPVGGPGEYHVYYLPYQVQYQGGWYGGNYLPVEVNADPAWLTANGLDDPADGKWKSLPQARVLEIEARNEFSRFDPMEVVATAEETAALVARAGNPPYIVFPEDRRFAIRMTEDIPLRWAQSGPAQVLSGEPCRNEYYCFQLGVFACTAPVEDVRLTFSDLRPEPAGRPIAASEFTCFNLGGTDWDGSPLSKTVSVPQGKVQALWCGVQIPREAAPGRYRGSVTVSGKGAPPTEVALDFTVSDEVLEDRGDGELWRYSRLRWLNSTLAMDDDIVAPYTPMTLEGSRVGCLGRALEVSADGLPAAIRSGDKEILAAPMRLVLEGEGLGTPLQQAPAECSRHGEGAVSWAARGRQGAVDTYCRGRMEFDGHVQLTVTLRPDKDTPVKDIRLQMPFRKEIATYLMGMDHAGGLRKPDFRWEWGGKVYYDSFWLGDYDAGLQCELRGATYCGPMVNLYWALGQLQPPATWSNEGKGGVTIQEEGDVVTATAYCGDRVLPAGEDFTLEFAFLITPVKPLDSASHFKTRYYHAYEPVEKIAQTGANVVNIHHANELNPYINYPFLTTDKMKAYVDAAHERDMKVKIYYTLRELTNHVAEMWALRSLGHEVLAPGSGGGYPWLREHLGRDYQCSWYEQQPDGEACASIVNSGLSRWYNYYLEGLQWLVQNVGIDGLYNDDVSYDRQIMKRVRKILQRNRPGSMIDLHSNTSFSHGPANQYMEFFPYIDRLWFGEFFDYDSPPDYWLTEISGIPYGLMGEMLQNGGNKWRGMVYGMTARMPWCGDPRSVWGVWDDFGIDEAEMLGYWEPECPVDTGREDILATAYVREGRTLIAVASWAPRTAQVKLQIDWEALGLDPRRAHLYAPQIDDYQFEALFSVEDEIPIPARRGWLLWVDEQPREAPPVMLEATRAYERRQVLLQDDFPGQAPADAWRATLSPRPGTKLSVAEGKVTFESLAHSIAYATRDLPPGVTMVECVVNTGSDGGMTWGPGLALWWGERFLRLNLRTVEGRAGVDDGTNQWLVPAGIAANTDYHLRLRLEAEKIVAELSDDGEWWTTVHEVPRSQYAGEPSAVSIGKMSGDGADTDADAEPNLQGSCSVERLRVYGDRGE